MSKTPLVSSTNQKLDPDSMTFWSLSKSAWSNCSDEKFIRNPCAFGPFFDFFSIVKSDAFTLSSISKNTFCDRNPFFHQPKNHLHLYWLKSHGHKPHFYSKLLYHLQQLLCPQKTIPKDFLQKKFKKILSNITRCSNWFFERYSII